MQNDERKARLVEKLTRELGPVVGAALQDPAVVEIALNPNGELWIERLGQGMKREGNMSASSAESLTATIASALGTVVNRENPIVEGELPLDGSRFEGLLPPVVAAPTFAIRKRASAVFPLANYVTGGIMTAEQAATIRAAVKDRLNIVVVGGTGSGKTTLVNAIVGEVATETPADRILIIEDTVEIQCVAPNVVALRTCDGVGMHRLLRATMRPRPDRIIVGEIRGPEALALVMAWNTGHPGGVATIHADDAAGGLLRIAQLIEQGLAGAKAEPAVIAAAVGLLVVIRKVSDRPGRKITEMVRVDGFEGGAYVLTTV